MRIVFELPDAGAIVAEAKPGDTLMRIAVAHDVPGITGDCGGQCACATCHMYIHPAWIGRIGPPEPDSTEALLLECAPADVTVNSRLGCQVVLQPEHDGLIIQIPEGQ